jgi:hypothetical protein
MVSRVIVQHQRISPEGVHHAVRAGKIILENGAGKQEQQQHAGQSAQPEMVFGRNTRKDRHDGERGYGVG